MTMKMYTFVLTYNEKKKKKKTIRHYLVIIYIASFNYLIYFLLYWKSEARLQQ